MPPLVTTSAQVKLTNPPADTISAVHFQPGRAAQFVLASSWDCTVRLYDVTSATQRCSYDHETPVLSSCFTDPLHALSGSLEGTLKYFDVNTSQGESLQRGWSWLTSKFSANSREEACSKSIFVASPQLFSTMEEVHCLSNRRGGEEVGIYSWFKCIHHLVDDDLDFSPEGFLTHSPFIFAVVIRF